jgi:hypothetical protein
MMAAPAPARELSATLTPAGPGSADLLLCCSVASRAVALRLPACPVVHPADCLPVRDAGSSAVQAQAARPC